MNTNFIGGCIMLTLATLFAIAFSGSGLPKFPPNR